MANEYEVLDIKERTRLNDANRPERYFVLTVKSGKGTLFTMDLGEDQLDPATFKTLIGARAKQLDALMG